MKRGKPATTKAATKPKPKAPRKKSGKTDKRGEYDTDHEFR